MHSIRNRNMTTLCEYLAIIICIFCSGSVMFQNNNKILLVTSILLLGFMCLMFKKKMGKKELKYFLFFSLLYTFTAVFHMFTYHISFIGEMGKVLQFVLAIIVCTIVCSKNFFKKYNVILYVLAGTSIVLYLIPFVFPEFPKLFPVIHDYAGASFHNAGLFCYPTYIGRFYRNQSIFWESGAFQAFLNLAIFIELYIFKKPSKKHLLIYFIALMLTKSTTGYIIFILLFLGILPRLKKSNSKFIKLAIACSPLLLVIFGSLFYSVIIQKFSPNSMSYASFVRRFNDTLIDIKILFGNVRNFFLGVSEENYIHVFTHLLNRTEIGNYFQAVSSNSITAFAAQYGMIAVLPIYYLYKNGIFSFKKRIISIIFCLMIGCCLATENLMMTPVFLAVMLQLQEENKYVKKYHNVPKEDMQDG